LVIGDTGQAIFSPAVGTRASLVMSEIIPGIPILAVVFPYCPPLAFAEIRAPFLPWNSIFAAFIQSALLVGFNVVKVRFVVRFHGILSVLDLSSCSCAGIGRSDTSSVQV